MIRQPDLPNAPMTRWILYLSLFDFAINHVPAISHQGPDGLSRRRRAPEDSDDDDAEAYLDHFINSTSWVRAPPEFLTEYFSGSYFVDSIKDSPQFTRRTPYTPYGSYMTRSIIEDLAIFGSAPDNTQEGIDIDAYDGLNFDPSLVEIFDDEKIGSLLKHSLLKSTDSFSYVGREFELRKIAITSVCTYTLGDELIELETTNYARGFLSDLKSGEQTPTQEWHNAADGIGHHEDRTDHRCGYEDVSIDTEVSCLTHAFGVKAEESPELWQEIFEYLTTDKLPSRCRDVALKKSFVRRTQLFFIHDDRIWKHERMGTLPRLVITDLAKRGDLIAQAHNEVGHRGRDATYKTLSERFYWPNLYDSVAYFVRSCYVCQLRSKSKPIVPFSPTWNSAILRRFDLDTVHMESGYGGKNYLLQAIEPSINWPEARAAAKNDSETWARFIYEDIICRFGCIPFFVVDGGSEFKGAAEILFKQYGIVVIMSSPYHPEGNGRAERAHQTLGNSIMRACGKDSNKWPLYVFAGLFAMRCTTTRVTGYTPYFLLYGRHPFFAFDIADRTWDTLDWDRVATTVDLIAIRAQQILRRDKFLVLALEKQKASRQRAVDDFNKKHERYLSSGDFAIGTWVLVHETWLDTQMGNKGALRWTGPYIVHRVLRETTYQLRELDGTVRRESYAADRLKIFYYREEHQTIRTVNTSDYAVFAAAASTAYAEGSDIFSRINFRSANSIPPYGLSVKQGLSFDTSNPRLEFRQPFQGPNCYARYPTIAELNEYCRVPIWSNSHVNKKSGTQMRLQPLNINDLTRWASEYHPAR